MELSLRFGDVETAVEPQETNRGPKLRARAFSFWSERDKDQVEFECVESEKQLERNLGLRMLIA
jgi:hypothetical protein